MNEFNPKVSIIVPVYNGSNYLREAIDSALAQTYQNIEIIVVNDGSNDRGATERIAKSYGSQVKYFKKENGGVATALNLGIEKMTGDFFSWLSHDDMYYADKVEKQVTFLQGLNEKKVVLYSDYSVLRDGLITPVILNHEMLLRKPKYSLLRGSVNGITILIPKSILNEVGKFSTELKCTQDYDYWRKIQKKYEFIHMPDVLSITRLHSGQDTVVSPLAVSEGNELWIDMVESLSDNEKLHYENTLYNFYFEMIKFLETTPYKETLKYCEQQLEMIEKDYKPEDISYKVSIIIPFYNRAKQTIDAIKSVLNQTYQNTEIILVNDASPGDIHEVVEFIKKHKNIRLINLEKNSGPSAARNVGIDKASGDYIAFLDSDDEFVESKLADQLASMIKYNPTISYTAYIRRNGNEDIVMRDRQLTGIVVPKIISGVSIATPTVIVNKKFLNDKKLRFDPIIRSGEDSCFWMEIAKHSEMLLVDKPLSIVNIGNDSHINDYPKLIAGLKNILTYVLNDPYYRNFYDEIALLSKHLFEVNNEMRQKEYNHLLFEGPVVSKHPDMPQLAPAIKAVVEPLVKGSIPYRATRMIYRRSRSIVKNRKGSK